ncbi:dipicolinate synthase subunit DpsA [Paenibacillus sp. IB182496]|uniref:Dipicolinate synthase subunit DpsA n=1 Tax=Paenibacillus sabuli TaxID=2772509 RepID=A0A927GR48_9BACL|nr:dipicolinate synthase subunit DpsA [Paenibacillus sabuli]MBD2845234.1 dipicolinate synthase subunit DpsA [Paenibacillus sabuli]
MLTGMQVLLLGGDARQLEVARKLSELDASVEMAGFDQLDEAPEGAVRVAFADARFAEADALVLPVPGCDEEGRVSAAFSEAELTFTEREAALLPRHCVVYVGMARSYLRELCSARGLGLVELLELDDVAIYNSIPTAEGALMMAIQNTDTTIHGSRCAVLGMGRTGLTLARVLQGLGASVSAGVRREAHFARAAEMGISPFYIRDLAQQAGNIDLLFNTIPTMIVTAQIIAKLPAHAVIIDLASKPGGTDFRYAEKRGMTALLAPGLPGIVAPKTAGRIIADCLSRLLLEQSLKRGDGR